MPRLACLAVLLSSLHVAAWAQTAPASPPPPEEAVRQVRIEDDNARIDELHVRGQVRRITVQPKLAGKPYEVLPADRGRDLSIEGARGAAGQSVWHFLSF